jgi:hypothetical protein
VKRDIEKLRDLLDLSGDTLRALDTLSRIQSVVSYIIDKYFTCGETRNARVS